MNPVSIIILLLIIAYCAFVIYKQVQKKKQGGWRQLCRLLRMQQFSGEGFISQEKRKVISNGKFNRFYVLCICNLYWIISYRGDRIPAL